jgi:UDP-glucose 4-epimerase
VKVMIIGSNGFIGSHAVKSFSERYTVKGFSRNRALGEQNLDNLAKLLREGFDVVVNCAGSAHVPTSFTNPWEDFQKNSQFTAWILETLRQASPNTHFINLSSAAVYGNPVKNPIEEGTLIQPLSPYGYHKAIADQICEEYAHMFKIKISVLRVFSAYGPGLRKQLFWDTFNKMKFSSHIKAFGSGQETRDFIYIDDLIQAIDVVLNNQTENFEIYNVGAGKAVCVSDAVNTFAKALGWNGTITYQDKSLAGYPTHWTADISKVKKIGFESQFSLEAGLTNYAKWLRELI